MLAPAPSQPSGPARPTLWQRLRRWLFDPTAAVTEVGDRWQAQILAGLALVLSVAALLSLLSNRAGQDTRAANASLLLVGGLSLAAYGLARTRYFTGGAWLITLSFVASAFADIVLGSDSPAGALFSFIPLALVVGAAFLSPLALTALTAVATIGSVLILGSVGNAVEASRTVGAIGVNATLGVLLAVGSAVRQAVERDRRAVLVATNAELQALRESLAERVAARTRDLAGAQARAEDALDRLAEASRLARLASFEVDLAGQRLTFSDRFYELLGTEAGQAGGYSQPIGEAIERFVHPEDAAQALADVQSLLAAPAEGERRLEYRLRRADGQIRPFAFLFQLERAAGGAAPRLRGAVQDVTELRTAEATLTQFKLGIERSTEAIFMTDRQGVIFYVNPAFEQVYGFSRAETLGQTPRLLKSGLLPPEAYAHFWETLLNNGTVAGEIINRTKDGRLVTIEGSNSPILDEAGHLLGFLAIHRDATQRKQAEAALARRAVQLETVTQMSTAIAAIADPVVMLQTVVDRIKPQFDLYHAHIYLLNAAGDGLVLTAGAGEPGRRMVAEKHTIPLHREQSLVARAARTRQAVIVNDVARAPDFLPNRHLPDTRAELAVPLVAGDSLLGVLDVQADQAERFTDEDARIQTILAAQIAVVLQNARSFADSERTRQELDRLTQRLTHEGWERFLGQTQAAGLAYVFDGEQAAPASAGSPLLTEASQVVAQPLTVRGHVIGQVAAAPRSPEAAGDDAAAADPELAAILAAVADGLSAHIDNLRLADQTQQALSQTEALYQLTARLNEARTLDEVVGVVAGVRDAAGTLLTVEADAQGQPAVLTGAAHWPAGVDTVGLAGARRPAAQFPAAQLWINAPDEPLLFEDLETDPRLDEASRAFNRQRGVRAAVYLPLRVGGAWVGLLVLAWPEPQRFSADEAQLYRALAAQAAVVVNNRLLFEQTRKRADREAVINAITQKIQGTATVQGALETALQELGQALRARRASVALAVAGAEAPAANGHDQPAAAGPAPR